MQSEVVLDLYSQKVWLCFKCSKIKKKWEKNTFFDQNHSSCVLEFFSHLFTTNKLDVLLSFFIWDLLLQFIVLLWEDRRKTGSRLRKITWSGCLNAVLWLFPTHPKERIKVLNPPNEFIFWAFAYVQRIWLKKAWFQPAEFLLSENVK